MESLEARNLGALANRTAPALAEPHRRLRASVEVRGLEPLTSAVRRPRSSCLSYTPVPTTAAIAVDRS